MDMNGPFWTLGSVGGPWDALARMTLIWFQADPGALGRMAEDLPKSSWRIRGHGSETHAPSELVLGKNVNYLYIYIYIYIYINYFCMIMINYI